MCIAREVIDLGFVRQGARELIQKCQNDKSSASHVIHKTHITILGSCKQTNKIFNILPDIPITVAIAATKYF